MSAMVLALIQFSGCESTQFTSQNKVYQEERLQLQKAGINFVEFESDGQLFNANYASLPERTRLIELNDSIEFRDTSLQFLYRKDNSYVFLNPNFTSYVNFSRDMKTGEIELFETGGLFFRSWKSRSEGADFLMWAQRFAELGFNENRLGFVPETKFVDVTRTELRSNEKKTITIEIIGRTVLWNQESADLSIVLMEGGSSAVQLSKDGEVFWLFGGGNFQTNSTGMVEVSLVGSSRKPTGTTIIGSVTSPYVNLYPRLKQMAVSGP